MLLEHLFGLLGCWYFLNPVGYVPLVIDELEDGIVGLPRFFAGQDGESIVVVANDQIIFEAAVQVPTSAGEALFYFFRRNFPPLSRCPT